MDYSMEELIPIVADLADTLSGYESTSITYEKAEQLMEAVLYCIHELDEDRQTIIVPGVPISAKEAYQIGFANTVKKVKASIDLYNDLTSRFDCFENICLDQTFIKGIPEFFKWYDVKFEPQNTILTLDYPILKDITEYSGIDRIFEFINCIRLEQMFLAQFNRSDVLNLLCRYNSDYKDMIENICEIVLIEVVGNLVSGKHHIERCYGEPDYRKITERFRAADLYEIKALLSSITKNLVSQYYNENQELLEYLMISVEGIAIRIQHAMKYHLVEQLFK